jgi:type VI secretion system secreted protein Hcp
MKMKAFGLAVGLCAFMLFGATAAQAAQEFYMSITGVRQGPFKGEVTRKGFEGKIAGLNFDYAVVSPRDPASGQTTGKRQHKPVRIKKAWGAASTQLFTALTTNESLATVVIDFMSTDPRTSALVLDHTIKLTNATVVSIAHNSEVVLGATATSLPPTETVEFTFQQIELIDHLFKAAVMDSLAMP